MARTVHDNRTMQTNQRFRFVAIVGLVVALLTAGISLAGGASDTPEDPDLTTCEPVDDVVDDGIVDGDETVDDGDVVDGDAGEPGDTEDEGDVPGDTEDEGDVPGDTEDEGDVPGDTEDEGDVPGDTEDCDDEAAVEDDEAEVDEEESGEASQAGEFTAQQCSEAAGLAAGEEPTVAPVPGEKHGLENAIAHLLWNCLDHPNHGLVNALTKHTLKLDAWLERQELKDERKAERSAAKAERDAARDAAKAARDAAHAAAKAAREAAKAARTAAHGS